METIMNLNNENVQKHLIMTRLKSITIGGYRSIKEEIIIRFPENMPVVIIGENNAGKSNIVRAIEILFGEIWPGTRTLEHHDFWQRDPSVKIKIEAETSIFQSTDGYGNQYCGFRWVYGNDDDERPKFKAIRHLNGEEGYANKKMTDELTAIVVNAERDLSYQLSYASKWTLLSKVMRKFHEQLTSDSERVSRLKGLFASIKSEFNAVPEFEEFSDKLSTIFNETLEGLSYGLKIDFSAYDPSNYFKSLRIQPSEGEETRSFEELGTGQQQILALSFANAYCQAFFENIVLIIEEPEAHLHPLAQKWLAKNIFKMAAHGLQVVITTHSPYFVSLMNLEGIVLVRKDEEGTYVVQLSRERLVEHCLRTGSHPSKTIAETICPFYTHSATDAILNGFFAKKVILVEGPTEELALPVYLERLDLNTAREGIAIIPVFGKGNLAKWWRLFTAFQIPTFICFDNDSQNDDRGVKRKDALKAIGIPEDQLNTLLSSRDWNLGERFCVFGIDFETTMRNTLPEYDEIESFVRADLGDSKPIVAKEVAARIPLDTKAEGWINLNGLKERILNLSKQN